MSVISVVITQSSEQIVSGIPKTVSITTNIASTIFFTLDGSDPTIDSTMYTGPIFIPYNQLVATLKVFATNGVDSSPIIAEVYMTDIVDGNLRQPHSATTAKAGQVIPDTYPYGTAPYQPQQGYLNSAKSNFNVYDPSLPSIPTGFDWQGNPDGYTNQPWNVSNYEILYTNRDAEGQGGLIVKDANGNVIMDDPNGFGIGTLPAKVTIQAPPPEPEQTEQFTTTFNPRALVIFQDVSKEDPSDPPQINRTYFSLDNPEKARDGNMFFNTGPDSTAPPSGTFIRAGYNARDNTMTYYYRDSWSNRWIISTAPYQPTGTFDGNMAAMAMGRNSHVYEWIPFARRILF